MVTPLLNGVSTFTVNVTEPLSPASRLFAAHVTIPADSVPPGSMTHHWDAMQPTASTDWVNATLAHFGQIDGMVLNAGVLIPAGLQDGSLDDMDTMWAVNFKGPLHLVQAALAPLKASGHGHSQIFALTTKLFTIITLKNQGWLNQAPFEAGENFFYAESGALAIQTAFHIYGNGKCLGMFQTRVINTFEEILNCTAHIAEVFSGANDYSVTPKNIICIALPGRHYPQTLIFTTHLNASRSDRLLQYNGIVRR